MVLDEISFAREFCRETVTNLLKYANERRELHDNNRIQDKVVKMIGKIKLNWRNNN